MHKERVVIRIKADGEFRLYPCQGETLPLAKLQELVGGYIEAVGSVLGEGWSREEGECIVMLVNEEGKLLGLPVNANATMLSALWEDVIAGDALLMASKGEELFGLTREAAENIVKRWAGK